MRKNITAKHRRLGSQWISLFVEDLGFTYTVGLAIHKSKRANCDWYNNRHNKRTRSVLGQTKKRSLKYLRVALELFCSHAGIAQRDKPVVIMPRTSHTAALAKYLVRFGFMPLLQDGQQVFVLTAHQTQEVQPDSWNTN